MFSRRIFEKLGYLDESLKTGWDTEYCYRARRNGYLLGCDLRTVIHHRPHSTRAALEGATWQLDSELAQAALRARYPEYCK
jgi:GT2 family glycosyltransferase